MAAAVHASDPKTRMNLGESIERGSQTGKKYWQRNCQALFGTTGLFKPQGDESVPIRRTPFHINKFSDLKSDTLAELLSKSPAEACSVPGRSSMKAHPDRVTICKAVFSHVALAHHIATEGSVKLSVCDISGSDAKQCKLAAKKIQDCVAQGSLTCLVNAAICTSWVGDLANKAEPEVEEQPEPEQPEEETGSEEPVEEVDELKAENDPASMADEEASNEDEEVAPAPADDSYDSGSAGWGVSDVSPAAVGGLFSQIRSAVNDMEAIYEAFAQTADPITTEVVDAIQEHDPEKAESLITDKLKSIKERTSEAKSTSKQLQSELAKLSAEEEQLKESLDTNQAELQRYQSKARKLLEDIDSMNTAIEALQKDFQHQLMIINSELDTCGHHKAIATEAQSKFKVLGDKLTAQSQDLAAKLADAKSQLDAVAEQQEEVEREAASRRKALEDLEAQKKVADEAYLTAADAHDEAEDQFKSAQRKLKREMRMSFMQTSADENPFKHRDLKKYDRHHSDIDDKLEIIRRALEVAIKKRDLIAHALHFNKFIAQHGTEVDKMKDSIATVTVANAKLQEAIKKTVVAIEDAQNLIQELERAYQALADQAQELEPQLQAQLNKVKAELDSCKDALPAIREAVDAAIEAASKLQSTVEKENEKVASKTAELNTAKAKLVSAQTSLEADLSDYNEKKNDLEQQIANLKESASQYETSKGEWEQAAALLDEAHTAAKSAKGGEVIKVHERVKSVVTASKTSGESKTVLKSLTETWRQADF